MRPYHWPSWLPSEGSLEAMPVSAGTVNGISSVGIAISVVLYLARCQPDGGWTGDV